MTKPLKRHESLKPLSREHHQILLLCWKIREGFKKDISAERIKAYASFFYETQLVPHFAFEEKEVFPLLHEHNPLRKQALNEHQRLIALFTEDHEPEKALKEIEQALEDHIRFEERVLFEEIQNNNTEGELAQISKKEVAPDTPDPDEWEDQFWQK